MRPNVQVKNLKAENGGVYINDTAAHTGDWDSIFCHTLAVGAFVSDNVTGAVTSVTIPAGAVWFGHFTSITLVSGTVTANNRTPKSP
jgi:hypothetical protein